MPHAEDLKSINTSPPRLLVHVPRQPVQPQREAVVGDGVAFEELAAGVFRAEQAAVVGRQVDLVVAFVERVEQRLQSSVEVRTSRACSGAQ